MKGYLFNNSDFEKIRKYITEEGLDNFAENDYGISIIHKLLDNIMGCDELSEMGKEIV